MPRSRKKKPISRRRANGMSARLEKKKNQRTLYAESIEEDLETMIMNTEPIPVSFRDAAARASEADRTVLLLRHSMRESLKNGTSDPPLTPEGMEYARTCAGPLAALGHAGFGASPRIRGMQTAEALRQGMGKGVENEQIRAVEEISDTAMFEYPERLDDALKGSDIPALLRQYFSTGRCPGMKDLEPFADGLAKFLTETDFGCRNMILISHDIVIVALMSVLKARVFKADDWCGYLEGAALFRSPGGDWTIGYAVPDLRTKKKMSLFI